MSDQEKYSTTDERPPPSRYLDSTEVQEIIALLRRFREETQSQATYTLLQTTISRLLK